MNHSSTDIAIIGMSALFAKAENLEQYWQNIFNKVDGITEADSAWIRNYYSPDSKENNRLCSQKGGFLHDLVQFEPTQFGIMPTAIDGGGPDQYLAIQLCQAALEDAGYGNKAFNRDRTGLIFGYGSYMNRGFANLLQHGLFIDQTVEILQQIAPQLDEAMVVQIRQGLKNSLPPFTAEMCPGLVPNNVSGRVANRLDLMGPNYVVDGACASSLISIQLGMEELRQGRCDMMVVGGVNASTPAPISMIFNQLGALTQKDIRPFDAAASGTMLGEGLGLLVIKRLEDAEREGDRIYAVLKGVGCASDGKALSSVAPRQEGQQLAMERVYQATQIDPTTISLLEAHGTSIPLGDHTEIRSVSHIFGRDRETLPHCAVGSVKSMVAHCTTAAGAAGLIKTVLALYHKVLPPTLCDEVNPSLELEKTPFYINNQTRPWIHGKQHPRRAAVNAFGFGGINTHAILEEYQGTTQLPIQQLHRHWTTELFLLTAATREELISKITQLQAYIAAHPTESTADISYSLSQVPAAKERLAIVAADLSDLSQKLTKAIAKLQDPQCKSLRTRTGTFYNAQKYSGKMIFLFPGEGSQYINMLADICLFFPQVRQWFDLLDEAFGQSASTTPSQIIFPAPTSLTSDELAWVQDQLMGMDIGPASVFVASIALYELLQEFGLKPDAMVGHSSGENSALTASKIVVYERRSQLIEKMGQFNQIIQQLKEKDQIPQGTMLAIGGISTDLVKKLIAEQNSPVEVAMDNCPNQIILFGDPVEIEKLQNQLKEQGGICLVLPFDRGYHTSKFQAASQALRDFYEHFNFQTGEIPVYSCANCQKFPENADEIRDLAALQWSETVLFQQLVQQLYSEGFRTFVEVGPSSNLTAFVEDNLRGRADYLAIATNNKTQSSLKQLQMTLGNLFTNGLNPNWQPLFKNRPVNLINFDINQIAQTNKPNPRKITLPLTLPVAKLPPELVTKIQAQLNISHNNNQAKTTTPDPTLWPFLGEILTQEADYLLCERSINLNTDLFLKDHVFGSQLSQYQPEIIPLPVIPFTFSLEIMAEAACYLLGSHLKVQSLHNLRGYRWLTIDQDQITLNIETQRQKTSTASDHAAVVKIFQIDASLPNQKLLVFEGEVRLTETYRLTPKAWQLDLTNPVPAQLTDANLYKTCMFHGPRLQGVTHLDQWSMNGIEADLVVLPTQAFFSYTSQPQFRLDPGLLDAAGQLVGYWISEQKGPADSYCFPFQVDAVYQYTDPLPAGQPIRFCSRMEFISEHQIEADFELKDAHGRIVYQIEGWKDICYQVPRNNFYPCRISPQTEFLSTPWMQMETELIIRRMSPFPENFLDASWGIWKRMLAHLMLNSSERKIWYALPDNNGLRRTEWLFGRIAAKDAVRQWAQQHLGISLAPVDIEIRTTEMGKPYAVSSILQQIKIPDLSISHSQGFAIAGLAPENQLIGIDLERYQNNNEFLQNAFTLQENSLFDSIVEETKNFARLGLWSAKEAASKAIGLGLQGKAKAWEMTKYSNAFDQLLLTYQNHDFPVQLWYTQAEVIAICLTPISENV